MTNSDYTDIIVVLDRSGSMISIKEDTEGGFATFIADQRALGGDARVTLVQFDDKYDVVYTARRIEDVPTLELHPRGSTALLDALGRTITAAGERLAAMAEDDRPGYVVVLTMTDGMENASREWTREKVFEAVKRQTDDYAWKFIFMGANQDAIAEGARMGFNPDLSLTYSGDHVTNAFSATSDVVSRTRLGHAAAGYTATERSASVGDDE